MVKIGLCGANGKMGVTLAERALKFSDKCNISAKLTKGGNIEDFCKNSAVIIDFSTPDILKDLLACSIRFKTKLVIGTTGLAKVHYDLLQEASNDIAIVYSANMSIGAHIMQILASKVAKILDSSYDVEIIDSHHKFKKDAPSGTALMLGKLVAEARGVDFEKYAVFDRHNKGARADNEIGFSSIRGGNIFGEHEILFASSGEIITIKHQALGREVFADGAIKAACWIADKPAGLYSMMDVLRIMLNEQ